MKKKVGIFGGSFNPIHTGHIALAKSLCEQAHLDEVWLMVSPLNPFKKEATDLLADDLRLEMVEKAIQEEPQLKACNYEFHLPKPSYTWHTLQALSKDYPDIDFTLLIGGDNWALSHRSLSSTRGKHRRSTPRSDHRKNAVIKHQ